MISKSQLIDSKIADAAFKIERDAISEVIEGRFATVLLARHRSLARPREYI